MITRIRLTSGEFVDTTRHTYAQAMAAKAARVRILVGGPDDCVQLPGMVPAPERPICPEDINDIQEVTS